MKPAVSLSACGRKIDSQGKIRASEAFRDRFRNQASQILMNI
jgi:hypothetical protein